MEMLTKQDVEDILYGAMVFGAGGGGDVSEGLDLLDEIIATGNPIRMVSMDDVPDDALLATPYLLGSVSESPDDQDPAYRDLPRAQEHPILIAYKHIASRHDAPIYGAIACELGGANTAVPFYVAAMLGGVVIDADPAGRAVPEITHSSYYFANLPASPIVAANEFGEIATFENVANDLRAETIVRALCQVSRDQVAAVDHVLPAHVLRPAILKGTLSRARQMGQIMRKHADRPTELPAEIASAAGGKIVFQGRVCGSEYLTKDGFTLGTFQIDGTTDWRGQQCAVDLKNENMLVRIDGTIAVTIPDIITVLNLETGDVVLNPHVKSGQNVAVVILPAPDIFTTKPGLQVFGPSYLGLNIPFKSLLSGS